MRAFGGYSFREPPNLIRLIVFQKLSKSVPKIHCEFQLSLLSDKNIPLSSHSSRDPQFSSV